MTGQVKITDFREIPGGYRFKAEIRMSSPTNKTYYSFNGEIDLTAEENKELNDLKAKISQRVLRDFREATQL